MPLNTLSPPHLIGDIGGTNARFAIIRGCEQELSATYACHSYETLESCISGFLEQVPSAARPVCAALAIAAPIVGDTVALTNHPWRFSIQALQDALGLRHLEVINDFTANALSVPLLGPKDRRQIGDGYPIANAAIAVIGPGSGLGVSGLLPAGDRWLPLSGEGGHVTLASATDRESTVLSHLRRDGHVSAERVISGPGIIALHRALSELAGKPPPPLSAAEITAAALKDACPLCVEAVDLFTAFLGTVAGNLALTLGARGGVYIAGGIVPRLGLAFNDSIFRRRFTEKGAQTGYLAPIPTYLITHPTPAFLGLRTLLSCGPSSCPPYPP